MFAVSKSSSQPAELDFGLFGSRLSSLASLLFCSQYQLASGPERRASLELRRGGSKSRACC